MHGRVNEERKKGRHMWTEPTLGNSAVGVVAAVSADDSPSNSLLSPADNSFFKDGRRISVGDCALFKPPRDSPPFIGIIRCLATGKENRLKLGVNWLYRPAEVKLGKGIQLDAAPNEVFYSFHKDEIPAASLLHPCKVAFLGKGVELPSGISSFVCRRVYDITNKCLWWLTDQDYINERQEEVDYLLCKTRLEMNATVQQGGRSSKPMNGPTSTSQLKSSSDSLHNNASSFPSQVKGKKRERTDQVSEPVKRDRPSKMDDGDFVSSRTETTWRSEISRFTIKGGLVDSEGVEKLVQLMQPERNEKKIDLIGRSVLASVVAATDKHDCLTRFVQLRGLPVFDEWLQEVHKGKIGDGSVPKDGDKSIEEFLLVLLLALEKIPVDLHALQMCNIGKSVNHLRTHKNLEIQKKARSLVDTWKKRVEAEMDAKSGSNQAVPWAARARLPEVSHSGHSVASSEVVTKSSAGQTSASKNISFKVVQGEATTKSASASPVSMKSAPSLSVGINVKEGQLQNTCANGGSNSPLVVAGDEKSSSSSQSHNNCQSCSSDHAKTGGYAVKEDARSSTAISASTNKITGGSSRHRKSMNGFPGPASSVSQREAGSGRNSSSHKNPGSLPHSNLTCEKAIDEKEVLTGLDGIDGSPCNLPEENNNFRIGDNSRKLVDIPKASSLSFGIECKSVKSHESSFSSINALVESCVKYSEANALISVGDNVGMNLLASVAAGEMSKSNAASPCPSPQRIVSGPENYCTITGLRKKPSSADDLTQDQVQSLDDEHKMEATTSCNSPVGSTEGKPILMSQEQPTREPNGNLNFSGMDVQQVANTCTEIEVKSEETLCTSLPSSSMIEKACDGGGMESCANLNACGPCDAKEDLCTSFENEEKVNCSGVVGTKVVDQSSPLPSSDTDSDKNLKIPVQEEQKPAVMKQPGCTNGKEVLQPSDSGKSMVYENVSVMKWENTLNSEVKCENIVNNVGDNQSPGMQKLEIGRNLDSSSNNCMESLECGQGKKDHDCIPMPSYKVSQSVVQESDQQAMSKGSNLAVSEADEAECMSAAVDIAAPSAAVEPDMETKLEFDLNEGFNGDDGKFGEQNSSRIPECSTGIQLISPLPVSSASNGPPASVTVASAAKRPFIPPENLLKIRGELGWKGSAATSAFRPAEPRKSLETPTSNTSVLLPDMPAAKPSNPPLDIDLNIPDERILEDMACQSTCQVSGSMPDLANKRGLLHDGLLGSASVRNSSGLDLDLNRVDEPADLGNHLTSNCGRLDVHPDKSASGGLLSVRRDFDLNDGPLDEVNRESSSFGQHTRNSVQSHSQLSVSAIQVNNADMANFSSWFSPMPAVNIQSIIPDRGEQPFPVVGPGGPQRMLTPTAGTLFTHDVYRGSVLSSSPNVPFASTPFQYPVFPFGTSFPLPSATCPGGSTTYVDSSAGSRLCFPAMTSQVLAPVGTVQSHYSRPFIVGRLDSDSGSAEVNRKWGKQGLDLNAGPQCPDMEGRDEISSFASRQLPIGTSQALSQEQSRIYQVSGGSVLKRKEPDGGGWESYKQSSWQ